MELRAPVVEAVVQTDGVETPYRRAGRGTVVLLLAAVPGLMEGLAAEYRVIEPLRRPSDPGGRDWMTWLRGLVDGLGLDRPALVVELADSAVVRLRVAAEPDRFGPVVEAGPLPVVMARLRSALRER